MKKNLLYILAVGALLFSSCDKQLDVEPQGGSVSDEQLAQLMAKDPVAGLDAMFLGALDFVHSGSRSGDTDGTGFSVWNLHMDLQGNDMFLSKTNNWFASDYLFNNRRFQTSSLAADLWYNYYKMVYKANQILDNVAVVPAEKYTDAVDAYKASLLTYRALGYYYLLSIYRDDYMNGGKTSDKGLPFYLTVSDAKGCDKASTMYTQLIKDLQDAVALFEKIEYDPTTSTADIDQTIANMVLARVALNAGKYDIAAAAAGAVIDSECYTLMNAEEYVESGFLDVSLPETMWGYNWTESTSNGNEAFAAWVSPIVTRASGNNKGIFVCMDKNLYDQIPDTDYRKKCIQETASTNYPADMISWKFATYGYYVDEVYMRLSEAYLLKAEAEARNQQYAAAQQTLFDLVSERDSAYTKSTKEGAELLAEIHLQSRIELWGEGHEWFTNKRFNVGVDRTSSPSHKMAPVKFPAGKDFTYQIPLSIEMTPNSNMTDADQNPA